jgi:hypothetical protein
MNRAALIFPACLILSAGALAPAPAQNLLATNAGFEANTAYYTPGWGWPLGTADALPGWLISLDPAGDGYAGAANNQSPQGLEGTHYGYIYSGTGFAGALDTAPSCRAAAEPGTTYTLWFLARGDCTWGDAVATVELVWYPDQDDGAAVAATNLDLTLPTRLSTDDPMQSFHITAVGPSGAHYAGARVSRPAYDYNPMIFDDFVIMAEPTVVPLFINKEGDQVVISWPRAVSLRLEETSDATLATGWAPVAAPPKGVGATNYVESPIIDGARFFRLTGIN